MWFIVGNGEEFVYEGPTRRKFMYTSGKDVRQAELYEFEDLYTKELLHYTQFRKFYVFDDVLVDVKIFEDLFNSCEAVVENEIQTLLDDFEIVEFDKIVLTYVDNDTYSIRVFKHDGTVLRLN